MSHGASHCRWGYEEGWILWLGMAGLTQKFSKDSKKNLRSRTQYLVFNWAPDRYNIRAMRQAISMVSPGHVADDNERKWFLDTTSHWFLTSSTSVGIFGCRMRTRFTQGTGNDVPGRYSCIGYFWGNPLHCMGFRNPNRGRENILAHKLSYNNCSFAPSMGYQS